MTLANDIGVLKTQGNIKILEQRITMRSRGSRCMVAFQPPIKFEVSESEEEKLTESYISETEEVEDSSSDGIVRPYRVAHESAPQPQEALPSVPL